MPPGQACGQHLAREQLERPHGVPLGEAGPLDAKDELGDAERTQGVDLRQDRLGPAEEKAASVERVPSLPERVRGREDVALSPVHVGLVLAGQVRPRDRDRLVVGRRDAGLAKHGQLLRLGAALGAEERELALHFRERSVRVYEPRVGKPGGAPHGGVAVRRHPDRGSRRLHRPGRQAGALQTVAVPLRRHLVALEQPPHDVELLAEDADPPLRRAERGGLLGAVAEPDAEHEAPAGDDVERRRLLGHLDRVQEREEEDSGSDAHVARLRREAGEERHRLEHLERRRQEVLAGEDRVEAGVAHEAHLLEVLGEPGGRILPGRVLRGYEETEAHAAEG